MRDARPPREPEPIDVAIPDVVPPPAPREGRGRRERFSGAEDQPEFLRRPVRRTRRDEATPAPTEPIVPDEPPRD